MGGDSGSKTHDAAVCGRSSSVMCPSVHRVQSIEIHGLAKTPRSR